MKSILSMYFITFIINLKKIFMVRPLFESDLYSKNIILSPIFAAFIRKRPLIESGYYWRGYGSLALRLITFEVKNHIFHAQSYPPVTF